MPRVRGARGHSDISAVHRPQRSPSAPVAGPPVSGRSSRMVFLRAADVVRRPQAAPLTPGAVGSRRDLIVLAVAILTCALVSAVRRAIPAGDGLAAQYYDNPAWTGTPFYSTTDR